jgi:hypothetical protein
VFYNNHSTATQIKTGGEQKVIKYQFPKKKNDSFLFSQKYIIENYYLKKKYRVIVGEKTDREEKVSEKKIAPDQHQKVGDDIKI